MIVKNQVPYPDGWMSSRIRARKPKITVKDASMIGFSRRGPSVILFDDPSLPRAKARFSVVSPPKNPRFKKSPGTYHFIVKVSLLRTVSQKFIITFLIYALITSRRFGFQF